MLPLAPQAGIKTNLSSTRCVEGYVQRKGAIAHNVMACAAHIGLFCFVHKFQCTPLPFFTLESFFLHFLPTLICVVIINHRIRKKT